MRRFALMLVVSAALPAAAQKEVIFGDGKGVVFREEAMDKRFARTKLAKLLNTGSDHPGCVQLLGGLFVALAELSPTIHKRDENFFLDPTLVQAVDRQLSTPQFSAMSYLVAMVRRVMLEKRVPDAWLDTATALNAKVRIIDLGRLRQANDGVAPVDSAYFQLATLRERYAVEVFAANSIAADTAAANFRDTYLDRDVAWGGVVLLDTGLNTPKKKKAKASEQTEVVAILEWSPVDPRDGAINYNSNDQKGPPPVRIIAKLAPKQYLELEKLPRGSRMLVKGRFWEMNRTLTEVEVRDAVLFEDRVWGAGTLLGTPADVATCPAAVNELTGASPNQPGGFKH
ncbi:MAG: hypothetical protein JNG84_05745 [Archangium sp.]|nr:hypothetical protein [Archangium sp.]